MLETIILPGEKLRILRYAYKMTMQQLGEKININPKTAKQVISAHELNGGLMHRKIKLGKLFKVEPQIFVKQSTLEEFISEINLKSLELFLILNDFSLTDNNLNSRLTYSIVNFLSAKALNIKF